MNAPTSYPVWGMAAIIQRAAPSAVAHAQCQALVALNNETREVVPSWTRFLLVVPVRFYLVTNREHPGAVAFLQIRAPVHDVATQRVLPLMVECQVRAAPGREWLVAQALHGDADFTYAMHAHVQRWVNAYIHHYTVDAVVRGFDQHRAALASHVMAQGQNIGLEIAARVGREDEHAVRGVVGVGPVRLPVSLADCPDPQALDLRVDLTATPERPNAVMALNQGREQLEGLIREAVVRWMVQVPLCDFAERFHAVAHAPLWRHLDTVTAPFGLRVSVLVLGSVLHPGAVEVVSQLEKLRREPQPFEIRVRPQGGLEVAFSGAFDVLGLSPDGYRVFARRRPEVSIVARELSAHARAALGALSYEKLCQIPPSHLKEILNASVQGYLRTDFGLDVEVRRLERDGTFADDANAVTIREVKEAEAQHLRVAIKEQQGQVFAEIQSLGKVRERLVTERNEAILGDLAPASIADIDRKIEQVDARIAALKGEIARSLLPSAGVLALAGAGGSGGVARGMLSLPAGALDGSPSAGGREGEPGQNKPS